VGAQCICLAKGAGEQKRGGEWRSGKEGKGPLTCLSVVDCLSVSACLSGTNGRIGEVERTRGKEEVIGLV